MRARKGNGWSRRRRSTPHVGADAPAAITRPAARVGIATSAPGYSLAGVRVTLATSITAIPTQDATAAQACGIRWSSRPYKAIRPPRANSQDRTSNEKYALCAFDAVKTMEYV